MLRGGERDARLGAREASPRARTCATVYAVVVVVAVRAHDARLSRVVVDVAQQLVHQLQLVIVVHGRDGEGGVGREVDGHEDGPVLPIGSPARVRLVRLGQG